MHVLACMALLTKILVPTDFSDTAERALDVGATLAARFGIPMVVFHVHALRGVFTPDGVVPVPVPTQLDVQRDLDHSLARLAERARGLGAPDVQTLSTSGDAWREIVRAAREHECDLIVMGTHGRSGLEHFLLGSVTDKVVRKADCSVLAVKATGAGSTASPPPSGTAS
jgi:nucleotide-binding universal stress UspA family protein